MWKRQHRISGYYRTALALSCLAFLPGCLLALAADEPETANLPVRGSAKLAPRDPSHVIGPGDQVVIRAMHAAEISDRPVRVDEDGNVRLPMLGRVKAGGLTVDQLATQLEAKLGAIIRDPQVSVDVVESRSHPVSVLGAVKMPGVYQTSGRKRLLDVLSMAGGIEADAGYSIKISRHKSMGAIPLSTATRDEGEFSVGEVNLASLVGATRPQDNIYVMPQDVVSVPRGKLVYVIGEVRKSGGFVLREAESMSVLQALSLAEGTTTVANTGKAKIMRGGGKDGIKTEVAVDIKKILAGKSPDIALLPEDVLIVPKSGAKTAAFRTVDTAISMGTGIVVWRR